MRSPPGRAFRGRGLRLEGDAELRVGAPDYTARAARAAVLEGQIERLRHTVGIRELEAGASAGDVLDRTVNDRRAAQRNTRVRFTALRSSAMAQPVAGPGAPIERPHLRRTALNLTDRRTPVPI